MKALILLILATALLHAGGAQANTAITYQGRLDAGGQPHTGTVGMDFRLYSSATDGNLLATQLGNSVQVNGGLFQVELDFGVQPYENGLWLRITVNGQHLTPRQRITGAPFALRALPADDCPTLAPDDEMVRVGGVCMDVFEASLWDAPVGGNQIIGAAAIDAACPRSGQPAGGADCQNFYARSVAGVDPARQVTWFQAQRALANSGKRLPSNAEWQMAVSGTPDGAPCNVSSPDPHDTGSQSGCVSDFGLFDMVGNVTEWVADWVPASTGCPGWGDFSDDRMCLSGASTIAQRPGALIRGGSAGDQGAAGPLAVSGVSRPSESDDYIGFRGAR